MMRQISGKTCLKGGCGHFESYSEKFYLVHVICRKVFNFYFSRTKSRGRLPCLKFDPLGSTPEHLFSGNPVTPEETRHPPQGNPSTLLADQGQLPADDLGYAVGSEWRGTQDRLGRGPSWLGAGMNILTFLFGKLAHIKHPVQTDYQIIFIYFYKWKSSNVKFYLI
jgi:hypothetical protein